MVNCLHLFWQIFMLTCPLLEASSSQLQLLDVQGCCWIEVKCLEPFDLGSSQWLGSFGHVKGADWLLLPGRLTQTSSAPCLT